MASMSQYCLGACTLSNKLSLVQPSNVNARRLSNLVVANSAHYPIPKSTFPQLSLATKRQLIRKVWCSHDAPGFSSEYATDNAMLIHKFFYAINSRDNILLEDVLSSDCVLDQDVVLQIPLFKEQSIIQFLSKLTKAMGPNIRFKIDSINDMQSMDDQSATAFWHLEWNNEEIPFTGGCSLFECEEADDKLVIRRIKGAAEPGKLGDFILKLLETASAIFDNFPETRSKQKVLALKIKQIIAILEVLAWRICRVIYREMDSIDRTVIYMQWQSREIKFGRVK